MPKASENTSKPTSSCVVGSTGEELASPIREVSRKGSVPRVASEPRQATTSPNTASSPVPPAMSAATSVTATTAASDTSRSHPVGSDSAALSRNSENDPDQVISPDEIMPVSNEAKRLGARLYLPIAVGATYMKALLDPGAQTSCIREIQPDWITELGVKVSPCTSVTTGPNGQPLKVAGKAILPIAIKGSFRALEVTIVPDLSRPVLLGMDAMRVFGIGMDSYTEHWWLVDNIESYPYETLDELGPDEVAGIQQVTPEEQEQLDKLLERTLPALQGKGSFTRLMKHKIHVLPGVEPIRQKNYPVSPKILEELHRQVDDLLAEGVIEPSTSEWSNPVVMIQKSLGNYRMCLDFRSLNAVSKKDAYPLPNMTGILDSLRESHYITTLDLRSAYYQVELEEESRQYTAFVVPGRGLFQFKGMPFGLSDAPPRFQRLADKIITPDMSPYVFAYLDDIVIATRTFVDHLYWLEKVLKRLADANLKINAEKSIFCREEVKYLGFRINANGLNIDPDKVEPMLNFPRPANRRKLHSFCGMASWYRRFIPDFATIAEPLTRLTSHKVPFKWGKDQEDAFRKIKNLLASAPVLVCPDFSQPFFVHTDASNCGLGAVLTQVIEGEERVVAYASRTLIAAERNYPVTERECLAVVWAIEHFRRYIEGYHFTVITDHSSLRWLHNLKNPTGRLGRWALRLQSFDYEIAYRKGELNVVPDALSRMYEGELEDEIAALDFSVPDIDDVDPSEEAEDEWYTRRIAEVSREPNKWRGWKTEGDQLYRFKPDPLISSVAEDLEAWKLVPARASREEIIAENHDVPKAGHQGIEKTTSRVAIDYYWPGMHRDIENYVRACEVCQTSKVSQQAPAGLMGRRVVDTPWTVVAADIMGPFPASKNKVAYLLVFQDLFTKWVELVPIRKADAKTIIHHFEDLIVCRWGAPEVLLTDNGTEFANKMMKEMALTLDIHHSTTPPYHAQANPVERVNRVLKAMMIAFIGDDHREWDNHVREFRFAYNTAVHSSLHVSPAFANFGRQPRPPKYMRKVIEGDVEIPVPNTLKWRSRMARIGEIHDLLSENLSKSFERQARYYDKHHRDVKFDVGDRVRRRVRVLSSATRGFTAKLAKKYSKEIYRVAKILSPVVYELVDEDNRAAGRFHVKDLIPVRENELAQVDLVDEDEIVI